MTSKPKAAREETTTPALDAFSPGPWQLERGELQDRDGWVLASFPYTLGDAQDHANARLVRAAPELAEALHFMCAAVRTRYDPVVIEYEGILDASLAALASAGWDADKPRRLPWGRSAGKLLDAEHTRAELVETARALLRRLDYMTTAEFDHGGERAEREALRAALAAALGCDLEEVYELPTAEEEGGRG